MPSPAQFFDHLAQDIRYALRGLRKAPGFAAAVVLTIGLGVGANVAMFGVVDRLMFRPYAYLADPGTSHRIYFRSTERGVVRTTSGYEYTRYLDLKKWTTSFTHYAAYSTQNMAIGLGESAREQSVGQVSASFFDFFHTRPALGRFFTAAEDSTPCGANVAVLGYAFWQREFGGDSVIGKTIQVGSLPLTIIGVAPRGFTGVMDAEPAVFMPITTAVAARSVSNASTYYTRYNWGWVAIIVRRKPNVSIEAASADATQAYRQSWQAAIAQEPSITPVAVAKPHVVVGAMKVGAGPDPSLEAKTALWVSGVAAIVLLIACANVANLLLARSLRRRREIAVRLALGVTRGRLVMQSLTESLVLSLLGSVVGLLVALWGGAAIRRMLISADDAPLEVFSDWRTLGVALGVALLSAVFTGLTPALVTTQHDLAGSLKAGAREGTYSRSRARSILLVTQGALSVVLLVGAALFVRSLERVQSMPMGYNAQPVLRVARNLRGMRLDSGALVNLRRQLLARAQAIPTVEYAAVATSLPFWSTSSTTLFVAGIDTVRKLGSFTYQMTTPDYFKVMGTRILRGRGITDDDRFGSPRIVVVSNGMARALWPGKDALGQCIRIGSDTMPCTTVVGIAEDIVQRDLMNEKRYQYYIPVEQRAPQEGNMMLLKLRGDPGIQEEEVRKALQTVMPGPSYVTVRPFREAVDEAQRSWRLGATMFVAFGVLALIVAATGLYGVIAYNVTQRTHELGVRVALGAQASDILRLVVGQGVGFAISGIVVGTALALFAAKWVEPLLFKQPARDPVIYAGVAGLLLLVAVVASLSPAVRAARADPNTALRSD